MNRSSRSKLFLALIVLIAFCLMIMLAYMVTTQNNKKSGSTSWSDFTSKVDQTMDQNNTRIVWHNVTKTTSGAPFLENDVYNTLEAAPKIGRITYNEEFGGWECVICVADISSAKVKGTSNPASILRSQSLIMDWPQDQKYISVFYPAGFTETASIPSSGHLDDHYMPALDHVNYRWDYSSWLFGEKSDCGYLVYLDIHMKTGKPGYYAAFDLANTADYGLSGSSMNTMHFNIETLPDPQNMSAADLQKYGIHNDSGYYVYADQAIEVT